MTQLTDKKSPTAERTSYDPATPPALVSFMLTDWKSPPARLPSKLPNAGTYAARRQALSALFPGELLVIPTGHEKVRSNDTIYRFRPSSDFFYLTGNVEPDCVLVLEPTAGGHRSLLFVEPNPGRSDATFFTDRAKGELWVGPRLGVAQSQARYGVDEARGLPVLAAYLEGRKTGPYRMLRGFAPALDQLLDKQPQDQAFATALAEMRLYKDRLELAFLQEAVDATRRGFEDVIAALRGARSEREVEGVFSLRARTEGNDVGYGTIAASGRHACILHWTRNDGTLLPGDLLLLDAGVEGSSLYTADITRTLPMNGKFTREQREIYDLVAAAQSAAFAQVKPGNDFLDPNRAAMRVLAAGLERLGILPMPAEEALREENQFYRRYSLHNVSHMLGLDVHDCAQARQEVYKLGKLKPGIVLTIEPGLYFQVDDLTVPTKYRGIGVRIEDDVVVTRKGMHNLSGKIPRTSAEIEAWMARIWKQPKPRKR